MKRLFIKPILKQVFKMIEVTSMIKFDCTYSEHNSTQTWKSYITRLVYFGSHYEMKILGKSDITIIFGNTSSGYFVYFPKYETGLNIS